VKALPFVLSGADTRTAPLSPTCRALAESAEKPTMAEDR
jgi:hypothetical protein